MNKITSIEDINALIAAGVEESTTLECKSDINTTSDKWKGEMSKNVSAMANANGGTIIYGVKESPHIKVQCRHNFQNKGKKFPFSRKSHYLCPKVI